MKLRKIDLHTADGLPALPMQISWVRDGILVIGMDSEMHVYSQWKPSCKYQPAEWLEACLTCCCVAVSISRDNDSQLHHQESSDELDSRNLKDEHLLNLVQVLQILSLKKKKKKKEEKKRNVNV